MLCGPGKARTAPQTLKAVCLRALVRWLVLVLGLAWSVEAGAATPRACTVASSP